VPVACEVVLALQAMVTRKFYAFDPVIVTVGRIVGGTKNNVIGDTALLDLTVRTFSPEHRRQAFQEIERVATGIAAAHAMRAEVDLTEGYPATINDPSEQAFAEDTLKELFGAQRWVDQAYPEAGSEDMSFVLEQVPGAYLNISACPPGADPLTAPDNHSPRAEFDDSVVPDIALFLAEIAIRRSRALASTRGGQA
jgi:hippurate hydrolase